MKANYATVSVSKLDKEIRRGVLNELEKYKDDVYDKIQWDIFQQAMAVCMYALEMHGWRGKRLRRFKDWCDDACKILYDGILGRPVTTKDILQHMKDKYGVDLYQSQYDWSEKEEKK